MQVPQGTSEI